MNSESARALGWELAHAREQISEGLRERLDFGLSQTEGAVFEAKAEFRRAQQEIASRPSLCPEIRLLSAATS